MKFVAAIMGAFSKLKLTRFELLIMVFVQFFGHITRWAAMGFPVFGNITPSWRCRGDQEEEISETINKSRHVWVQSCKILHNCTAELLTYHSPFYSSRQEFGLICDLAYRGAMMSTTMYLGILIGASISGQISDLFGRRRVLAAALLGEISFNIIASFSNGITMLTSCLFFSGLCVGADLVTQWVFLLEMIKPTQRLFLQTFFGQPLVAVLVLYIAWIVQDWRWFLRATSILSLPTVLILLFVIPESIKWSEDKGKRAQVQRSQNKIDRINTITIIELFTGSYSVWTDPQPQELVSLDHRKDEDISGNQVESNCCENESIPCNLRECCGFMRPTFKDLLLTREMRRRTAGMCFLWLSIAFMGYTITFDSRNLSGNFYVNQLLFAIVSQAAVLSEFLLDTLVPAFSRRLLHQVPTLLTSVFAIAIVISQSVDNSAASGKAVTVLAIMSYCTCNPIWDAVYLCTAEMFPTEVRSSAFSICNLFARVGVMIAPQAIFIREFWQPAPYAMIAIVGLLSFVLSVFFLPETKNIQLPQSVDEISRKSRKR